MYVSDGIRRKPIRRVVRQRPRRLGFNNIMGLDARNPVLLLANNKAADKPAHPHSLISGFVIRYLRGKVPRSDISFSIFWWASK